MTSGAIIPTKMQTKPAAHLIDIILNRNEGIPNYVLFLGAGASWYSGVRTASEMIGAWRNMLYEHSGTKENYNTWLSKQDWYDTDGEYGYLFERLFDERAQRRDYIENLLDKASPSWGYLYLASLMQGQVFNAVFTTNFDDLINEACYLYTDGVRPLVCAHDSEVTSVRLTKKRPKIIKLHGDFLFDSIKNTHKETKILTKNMETKLVQFGQEYGLVVIGYGGRDDSVMSLLDTLITKQNYFKHGIYWCIRKDRTPRAKVEQLLQKDRVHAIEIQGFDQFMAELHQKAGLKLPPSVINPMKVAEQRTSVFCSVPKQLLDNQVIREDRDQVLASLGESREKDEEEEGEYTPIDKLPRKVIAALMRSKGDLEQAAGYLKLETDDNPDDKSCAHEYADILVELGKAELLEEFVPSSAIDEESKTYYLLFVNDDEVIKQANEVIAREPGSLTARINRAIAYKRLNKIPEMEKDLKAIEERDPDESFRAGIAALRKDKKEMLKILRVSVDKGLLSTEHVKKFPVFEDYHEDEDFKKFVRDIEKEIGK